MVWLGMWGLCCVEAGAHTKVGVNNEMARAAHPRDHVRFSFYSFWLLQPTFWQIDNIKTIRTMAAATYTAIESHTHKLQQLQI